jgi:hypothetical protein
MSMRTTIHHAREMSQPVRPRLSSAYDYASGGEPPLECVWAERTQFGPAHSDARPVNSNHAERFYGMLAVMRYPGEQWIAATRELTRRSLRHE